ncbi:heavy metal translocating P-type ATPase [Poronia punctata]|nr:heavy metal translocating P-type ATPase [Poronia punctata]
MGSKKEAAGFELSSISSLDGSVQRGQPRRKNNLTLGSRIGAGFRFPGTSSRTARGQNSLPKWGERARMNICQDCRNMSREGGPAGASATLNNVCARSSPVTSGQNLTHPTLPSSHSFSAVGHKNTFWRVELAIEGMTCSSCVNAITRALEEQEWVTKAAIDLFGHRAAVEFTGNKEKADDIVATIESIGYGATLNQITAISDDTQDKGASQERTVKIRIDGFHCSRCGVRVTSRIAELQHDVQIDSGPTWEPELPILTVTYVPQAPTFTIRRILAEIEAIDPAFKASVFHPPTLEEHGAKAEAQYRNRILYRVLVTFLVAIPSFVIGIVYMSLVSAYNPVRIKLMEPLISGINTTQFVLLALATPVYLYSANIFHRKAFKELWSLWRPGSRTPFLRRLYRFGSMNTLISLGTTVAYISSVAQLISAAVARPDMIDDHNFYFDSVVFLTLFLLIGRYLEAYSHSKIRTAVEALGKLRPTEAILVKDEKSSGDIVVKTELLDFGDIVRVPRGASPPCDGEIVQGSTTFDEASLTGESRAIKKDIGDQVFSGTVNTGVPVLVRVTGIAGNSMLDQILQVVREGQTRRAPVEKLADTLVGYFVPVITLIAVMTWVVWFIISATVPALGVREPAVFSLQFAIAVFVVACPCGLGLAGPTAIYVGSGLAAKHGILVKGGGEAFETASRIDCVVFDKTGTLTEGGEPSVTDTEILDHGTEEDRARLLGALRAVEENSSHPIAKAIVNYCKQTTPIPVSVEDPEEIPGRGLKATCNGETPEKTFAIIIGNEALMRDNHVTIPPAITIRLQTWKTEAKSVVLVATQADAPKESTSTYVLRATLAISDPIRAEAPAVVRSLRSNGCDVWMLSGDNITTARAVALRIGIPEDNVIAEVLPTDKADKIKQLQSSLKARRGKHEEDLSRRATVAMVGDGINDAPALTMADVGVAIGSGSDVAISSADFVLINSDLNSVVTLMELSRKVFRRIKFNFGWAVVYNVIAIPVAAGCFYAIVADGHRVKLDPVWASLAMALSSISVVLSSLALRLQVSGIGYRPRKT